MGGYNWGPTGRAADPRHGFGTWGSTYPSRKDIAEPINVPSAYIAKILQALSKKDIISSTRGPKGGFYLTKNQFQTNVMQIIEAVDGEERLNSCLLSLEKCNSDNPCSLHHLVYEEKHKINERLKRTTLEDLRQHIMRGESILPL